MENEENGGQLVDELNACQHCLTDSGMKKRRHKVKLDQVFDKLDCAAKIKIALRFVLRNIGTIGFRLFYVHEKKYFLIILCCFILKQTWRLNRTRSKIKISLNFARTQERQNTKRRLKLITNVTIFGAPLKKVHMGFPDSIIPRPLLRNYQVNCLVSDVHQTRITRDSFEHLQLNCIEQSILKHPHWDFSLFLLKTWVMIRISFVAFR